MEREGIESNESEDDDAGRSETVESEDFEESNEDGSDDSLLMSDVKRSLLKKNIQLISM